MFAFFFKEFVLFLFMLHVYVYMSVHHVCEGAQGAREVSDPLELKLQAVESLFSWVQEVTSGSPGEQDVLLTAELFLQVPPGFISFNIQLQLKGFF